MLLCEVLLAGSSAVVRAVRVAGGAGGGLSWRVLACRGGASRQSRVLGARGASVASRRRRTSIFSHVDFFYTT